MATPQQTPRQANPNAAMYDNTLFDIPNPEAIAAQERMALKAQQYQEALNAAKMSGQESLQFELANSRQAVGDSIGNLFGPKGDSAAVASAKKRAGILQGVMQETSNLSDPMERFGAIYEKLNAAGLTNDAERVRQKMLGLEEHKSELAGKAAEVANKTATTNKTNKDNSDRQRMFDYLEKQGYSGPALEKAMAEYDATGSTGKALVGESKFGDSVYGTTFALKDDKGNIIPGPDGRPQFKQMVIEGKDKGKMVDIDANGIRITNNNSAKGGNAIVEKNETSAIDMQLKLRKELADATAPYRAVQTGLRSALAEIEEGQRTGNLQLLNNGITKAKRQALDIQGNDQTTGAERKAAETLLGLLPSTAEGVSRLLTGKNTDGFIKDTKDQVGFLVKGNREGMERTQRQFEKSLSETGISGAVLRGLGLGVPTEDSVPAVRNSTDADNPVIMGPKEMGKLKDQRKANDQPAGKVRKLKDGTPYVANPDGSWTFK